MILLVFYGKVFGSGEQFSFNPGVTSDMFYW